MYLIINIYFSEYYIVTLTLTWLNTIKDWIQFQARVPNEDSRFAGEKESIPDYSRYVSCYVNGNWSHSGMRIS